MIGNPIKDDPQIAAMAERSDMLGVQVRVQRAILSALDTAILLEKGMKTPDDWVWTAIGFTLAAIVLTAEANSGMDVRNKITEAYGNALQSRGQRRSERAAQKGTKQ